MAFTRVQTVGAVSNAATFAAVTPGNLLVCFWVGHDASPTTCSDSVNGAWTKVDEQGPNFYGTSTKKQAFFYFIGTAAGSPVVTVANSTANHWVQIAEYSSTTAVAYDAAAYVSSGAGTVGTSLTITSGTPGAAGLLLMGSGCDNEAGTYTASTNYTLVGVGNAAAAAQVLALGENIGSSVATAMTVTDTDSTAHAGEIIGFGPVAAGSLNMPLIFGTVT